MATGHSSHLPRSQNRSKGIGRFAHSRGVDISVQDHPAEVPRPVAATQQHATVLHQARDGRHSGSGVALGRAKVYDVCWHLRRTNVRGRGGLAGRARGLGERWRPRLSLPSREPGRGWGGGVRGRGPWGGRARSQRPRGARPAPAPARGPAAATATRPPLKVRPVGRKTETALRRLACGVAARRRCERARSSAGLPGRSSVAKRCTGAGDSVTDRGAGGARKAGATSARRATWSLRSAPEDPAAAKRKGQVTLECHHKSI